MTEAPIKEIFSRVAKRAKTARKRAEQLEQRIDNGDHMAVYEMLEIFNQVASDAEGSPPCNRGEQRQGHSTAQRQHME